MSRVKSLVGESFPGLCEMMCVWVVDMCVRLLPVWSLWMCVCEYMLLLPVPCR